MTKEYISHSPEETAALAGRLSGQLCGGDIILYRGGMGAGKTTFTKGMAAALGVTDPVTSPTFALVNEYPEGRLPLFHFDLYRIDNYDDLYAIGFFDYLVRDGVCVIEWSENIAGLYDELSADMSHRIITISIEKLSDDERSIKITGEV